MGLLDVFEAIGGICECTKDFVEEVVDLTKSTGESIRHINDETYETSYEKRDRAREMISKARVKWNDKTYYFKKKLSEVEAVINSNNEKKTEILSTIERKSIDTVIKELRDIDSPYFSGRDDFNFGSFLGAMGDSIRMEAANEYLEDAKEFRTMINGKIAQLERVESNLDVLLFKLKEEKEILSVLEEGVQKNKSLNKEISKSLQSIIDTYICDKDGQISEKYVEELEQLKRISEKI